MIQGWKKYFLINSIFFSHKISPTTFVQSEIVSIFVLNNTLVKRLSTSDYSSLLQDSDTKKIYCGEMLVEEVFQDNLYNERIFFIMN